MTLGTAFWFALPVICAGAIHIAVIRADLLPRLGRWRLDGGVRVGGRDLFGANKTVRGLLIMTVGCALFAGLASRLAALGTDTMTGPAGAGSHLGWFVSEAQRTRPLLWGAALGAGYVFGELPNSFIKRRLGIAPGALSTGRAAALFWFFDQTDSLAGVLIAARLFGPVPIRMVGGLLLIALVVHPLAAFVMVALGSKSRIG